MCSTLGFPKLFYRYAKWKNALLQCNVAPINAILHITTVVSFSWLPFCSKLYAIQFTYLLGIHLLYRLWIYIWLHVVIICESNSSISWEKNEESILDMMCTIAVAARESYFTLFIAYPGKFYTRFYERSSCEENDGWRSLGEELAQ